MSSRFLTRDSCRRRRPSQLSRIEIESELSNCFSINLVVVLSFNQLYEYLNNNYLLTESQSGFRPMFSTETALHEVTNEWLWKIDNKLLNGVVFLALKKVFDTMDHAIFYKKSSNSMGSIVFLLLMVSDLLI